MHVHVHAHVHVHVHVHVQCTCACTSRCTLRCVLEKGVFYWYESESDTHALGALVLCNAVVRRPTSSKPGKCLLGVHVIRA